MRQRRAVARSRIRVWLDLRVIQLLLSVALDWTMIRSLILLPPLRLFPGPSPSSPESRPSVRPATTDVLLLPVHAHHRIHSHGHLPLVLPTTGYERFRVQHVRMPRFAKHGLSVRDERRWFHPWVLLHHLRFGDLVLFSYDPRVIPCHRVS